MQVRVRVMVRVRVRVQADQLAALRCKEHALSQRIPAAEEARRAEDRRGSIEDPTRRAARPHLARARDKVKDGVRDRIRVRIGISPTPTPTPTSTPNPTA